jgi:hypothetical protein
MTNRKRKEMNRRIRVRGIRRHPPDLRKLGQAIIALAQAQAEKEAEIEHKRGTKKRRMSKDD